MACAGFIAMGDDFAFDMRGGDDDWQLGVAVVNEWQQVPRVPVANFQVEQQQLRMVLLNLSQQVIQVVQQAGLMPKHG